MNETKLTTEEMGYAESKRKSDTNADTFMITDKSESAPKIISIRSRNSVKSLNISGLLNQEIEVDEVSKTSDTSQVLPDISTTSAVSVVLPVKDNKIAKNSNIPELLDNNITKNDIPLIIVKLSPEAEDIKVQAQAIVMNSLHSKACTII